MMASPLITTLGGTCCRPSALRSRLSTTTILVNEVTMTATNGAIASATTMVMTRAGEKLLKSMGILAVIDAHADQVAQHDQATRAEWTAIQHDVDGVAGQQWIACQWRAGMPDSDVFQGCVEACQEEMRS